jgi:hypothetical protein
MASILRVHGSYRVGNKPNKVLVERQIARDLGMKRNANEVALLHGHNAPICQCGEYGDTRTHLLHEWGTNESGGYGVVGNGRSQQGRFE